MAPVDRLLRADRPSQTVPPAACPHHRTPIAPSWPPRIIAVTSEIRTGQPQELFLEVPWIHDEAITASRLSMMRIMAMGRRRQLWRSVRNREPNGDCDRSRRTFFRQSIA